MTAHACSMLASGGGADTEMNEKLLYVQKRGSLLIMMFLDQGAVH